MPAVETDTERLDVCMCSECVSVRADLRARIGVLEGALEPFAEFGRYIQAHSRRGLDNLLYSWDGSESSAVCRQSDLIRAAAALAPYKARTETTCPRCGGTGEAPAYSVSRPNLVRTCPDCAGGKKE